MSGSLHERIRQRIETRIRSGSWPPGFRIPYEHELMADYGCSRMTVSKALSSLAAEGLIERRRRAGSFVARPQMHATVLDIHDIRDQIRARGMAYDLEIISRRQRLAIKSDMALLELEAPSNLLSISCLHRADGKPFVAEDRLINLAVVPEAAHADFDAEPPGTWLISHVGWTEAEHRISAVPAGARMAARLGISATEACLLVRRRTWREKRSITAVTLTYPGAHYEMVARFGSRRAVHGS